MAERTALVKALRGAGDRDQAKAVGALRKPSIAEWALNQVARDAPEDVERLLDALDVLRDAQAGAIASGGADELRAATEARRSATADLSRRAARVLEEHGRDPAAQSAAVAEILRRLGTSSGLAAQLRAGRVGSAPADDEDPFAGLEPSTVTARSTAKPPPTGKGDGRARKKEQEEDAARRERERQHVVTLAERRLDKARDALARAEKRLADATEARADAEARLARAQDAEEKAAQEHAQRAEAVEQADGEVHEAQEAT